MRACPSVHLRPRERPDLVLPTRLLPYFGGYTWPGNVRELENIIERIVVLARGDEITLNDLPDFLRRERPAVEALHLDLPAHGISLETVEKELIVRALDKWQPDSRRSVPGYQSQDADLSHGEVRTQEGTGASLDAEA